MIATEIGIRIQFKHDRGPRNGEGNRIITATTRCILLDSKDNDISVGSAFCLDGDQFNKEIGRRLALTRAVASSGLNKEDRRTIWNTYFGRRS